MGYKTLQLKLPTNYSKDEFKQAIKKKIGIKEFNGQAESGCVTSYQPYLFSGLQLAQLNLLCRTH